MHEYFSGWYFRCQSDSQTLAVIPAVHRSGTEQSCSIQLITDDASWNVGYPITDFHRGGPVVLIGESHFCPQGIRLELHAAGLHASGTLQFGPLTLLSTASKPPPLSPESADTVPRVRLY